MSAFTSIEPLDLLLPIFVVVAVFAMAMLPWLRGRLHRRAREERRRREEDRLRLM